MSFEHLVVRPVQRHMKRRVRCPAVGTWRAGREGGLPVLSLTLDAASLGTNLQDNEAASPFFLLCFAYWHARLTGTDPALRLHVTGPVPSDTIERQHYRRAWIAIEALEHALGDRLLVTGAPTVRWPDAPVINAPRMSRNRENGSGGGREHQVEVQLTRELTHAAEFSQAIEPIAGFHRQLPLGLFEGVVAKDALWTPGGSAQADLWATSPGGDSFHVFELKVKGNRDVGILPEILAYSWLLHRTQRGFEDGRGVRGGGPGAEAVRQATRLVAWLLAPDVHPLLFHDGDSPIRWLAEGLRDRIELGMLFYDHADGNSGFGGWRFGKTWRP